MINPKFKVYPQLYYQLLFNKLRINYLTLLKTQATERFDFAIKPCTFAQNFKILCYNQVMNSGTYSATLRKM